MCGEQTTGGLATTGEERRSGGFHHPQDGTTFVRSGLGRIIGRGTTAAPRASPMTTADARIRCITRRGYAGPEGGALPVTITPCAAREGGRPLGWNTRAGDVAAPPFRPGDTDSGRQVGGNTAMPSARTMKLSPSSRTAPAV